MKNKISKISLFSVILACAYAMPSDAKVSVKRSNSNSNNRSYAEAYQQVNEMRFQQEYLEATAVNATTASATAKLPVMVDDKKLENAILNNESDVTISQLDACSMIYPNGVFRWAIPESGVRNNQTPQCVAVVDLKMEDGTVLATTTLAAGDVMKCNVDNFPESSMSSDLKHGKIEIPADEAPTMEDVESVMNQEQKQNAGIKIAAGALIAGVAGNLLAPKEAGDTKLFGTGKTQLIDTAIGAATGAGIMAASSYGGKVAGDTIKSTAVNAASGMIAANVFAGANGGDSVLATTKCKTDAGERDCIIGSCAKIDKDKQIDDGIQDGRIFFINKGKCNELISCKNELIDSKYYTDCKQEVFLNYVNITVADATGTARLCSSLTSSEYSSIDTSYYPNEEDHRQMLKAGAAQTSGEFLKVKSASMASNRYHAYAVLDLGVKPFGYTMDDWTGELANSSGIQYFHRNTDYTVGAVINRDECEFQPSTRDAEDGALVDLSNQARAKATLIGTATGGAMGGFAGYQGAKSEITDRWTAAVREYNDSLSKFVCTTGGRFLSKYNDYVEIPEPTKLNEQ